MNKLIIANTGTGYQGKSSSIKEFYNLLVSRYPDNVQIIHTHWNLETLKPLLM